MKQIDRNKAVADGAVSFYLDHSVRDRVSRWTYGIEVDLPFWKQDPDHFAREDNAFIGLDGIKRIGGNFSVILAQVMRFFTCEISLPF